MGYVVRFINKNHKARCLHKTNWFLKLSTCAWKLFWHQGAWFQYWFVRELVRTIRLDGLNKRNGSSGDETQIGIGSLFGTRCTPKNTSRKKMFKNLNESRDPQSQVQENFRPSVFSSNSKPFSWRPSLLGWRQSQQLGIQTALCLAFAELTCGSAKIDLIGSCMGPALSKQMSSGDGVRIQPVGVCVCWYHLVCFTIVPVPWCEIRSSRVLSCPVLHGFMGSHNVLSDAI